MRHHILRIGAITMRLERRATLVGLIAVVLAVLLSVSALLLGDYQLSVPNTIAAIFGQGTDRLAVFFVQQQRAPRIVAALVVGMALGSSGALFQSLTANPLGSPDIIGFTVGSATGALLQIIVFEGGPLAVAVGAVAGGFSTAGLVYSLAWRHSLTGTRLVLVGIGVSSMLQGINHLLIVRASLSAAQNAAQWQAGSFNATSWGKAGIALIGVAVLLPCALSLARPLGIMATGDEMATALAVPVEKRRWQTMAIAVALVSLAVAIAGPIAFVALAAPHIARKLSRTGTVGVGCAALVGAVLVLGSDIIAQRLFAPTQLPVGVVTGTVGGLYLIWLLSREWKKTV